MRRDIDILEIMYVSLYKIKNITNDEKMELYNALNSIEQRLQCEIEKSEKNE